MFYLGDIKPISSEIRSAAHDFVEHLSPIKFTGQSVNYKEILSRDTDGNLHNLEQFVGGPLGTLCFHYQSF